MIDLTVAYLQARRRTLLVELDAIEDALEMPEHRKNKTLRAAFRRAQSERADEAQTSSSVAIANGAK